MKDGGKNLVLQEYEERLAKKQPSKDTGGVFQIEAKSSTELSRTKNRSGIAASLDNAKLAIQQLGIIFKYDAFRLRICIEGYGELLGETLDDIELRMRDVINDKFKFDPEPRHTRDAIRLLALQNSFDPVRDFLDGLKWDGTLRLDTWLSRYLGADDDKLTRAMGRAVLIAGVRRVRSPGCKFDFVLVLEGPQGRGKSTALKVLAGGEEYFSDEIVIGENYKEQQELLRGKWIVEMPELAGLNNAEVRRVKQFISKTHDRARGAWQRAVEEVPRRCILIGTTNDAQYLRDATGNRRFWPVVTGKIDLVSLKDVRDQLWAEAAALEPDAADPITIPEALWAVASERQAARVEADAWEDILIPLLGHFAKEAEGELRITTRTLFEQILMIEMRLVRQADSRRLGNCMRRLGWDGPKPIWVNGNAIRGYAKATD